MAEKDRQFRAREKEVRVKLTEAELQYTKDKALSCKLTMSEYIRRIIFTGIVIKLDTFDIKQMSVELNRIGTNINQIAKHVNEKGDDYDKKTMAYVIQEFEKMKSALYAKALGMEYNEFLDLIYKKTPK